MKSFVIVSCSVFFFFLSNCSGKQVRSTPRVKTQQGIVEGFLKERVYSFLGLPYAATPKGNLRWKAPQPPSHRQGLFVAKNFGMPCPQIPVPGDKRKGVAYSEDCLHLNIWTPTLEKKKLPVIVWFHGGQYLRGSSSRYSGESFARNGDVVFVSLNYRLGPMGFLAHPGLTKESIEKSSGNQAVFDKLQALRWLQKNIENFGGDPGNVTIAGQSAGSVSVCALLTTPLGKGLYHKAIMQSNACAMRAPSLKEKEKQGRQMAKALGCKKANLDDEVRCIREKPIAQVLKAIPLGTPLGGRGPDYRYNLDNHLLTQPPGIAIKDGNFNKVPILIGTTGDEMSRYIWPLKVKTVSDFQKHIKKNWKKSHKEIFKLYSVKKQRDVNRAMTQLYSDFEMTCPTLKVAHYMSSFLKDIYMYRFTHEPKMLNSFKGSWHGAELAYLFHGILGDKIFKYSEKDLEFMKFMIKVWSSFALTGNPNAKVDLKWKPYNPRHSHYMDLSLTPKGKTFLKRKICEFWNQ